MKSWASNALAGAARRPSLLRIALAIAILGGALWALPLRRPADNGGHHDGQAPALDPFEKAGVTEFKEGQRGAAFRLQTLDGRSAALEDYRDKLVILNFWATWCEPCAIEMPTLEALGREYRRRGLVVLGISVDRGAPRLLLEPYVRNHRLTFPILLDPDLKTAGAWRVTGIPATFLIRPQGDVAGMVTGAREWHSAEMRALVETMLPGARAR